MSKLHYDYQSHILSIKVSKGKSVDSDVYDNIVLDYDRKGNIVNIDVMNIGLSEFERIKATSLESKVRVRERLKIQMQ